MTHTLTIYGKDVRVSVQTKGLGVKAASEVTAHFSKTISQALLDAPHVGVLREQQVIELDAELLEKVEEALKAIEYPGVASVQVIFNMFRHRPSELFFREAQARNIGVIARVPLASGLLTGKMTASSHLPSHLL